MTIHRHATSVARGWVSGTDVEPPTRDPFGRLRHNPAYQEGIFVLELVYTGILVLAFAFIGWFSVYVVYKLYQGQR